MTQRKTVFAYASTAAASSLALALVMGGSAAADPSGSFTGSCTAVQGLQVAPEDRSGYDRDLFGDYDRDALLAASMDKYGDYYSVYDNKHYTDSGEVDVDHAVALAEAWDSGADEWSAAKRDQFAGDTANLTLLTDNLNSSKGSEDIAEWLPPYDAAVDGYVTRWVNVKSTYDLSVDQAELDALLRLTGCSADGGPPADGGNQDGSDDSGNNSGANDNAPSVGDDGSGSDDSPSSDATGGDDNLAPVPTPAEAHIAVTG